mmetsp:Transcript_33638/g.49262  ORF Transcript_33638/g.49262 Transcript_33638/m.49262 type:complete len:91 (+) Transcript_33638:834-1106(+)
MVSLQVTLVPLTLVPSLLANATPRAMEIFAGTMGVEGHAETVVLETNVVLTSAATPTLARRIVPTVPAEKTDAVGAVEPARTAHCVLGQV